MPHSDHGLPTNPQSLSDSWVVAQIMGLGQTACQRHRIFNKGLGYAVTFRIDVFLGH
jgi:hypothetical protein